VLQFKSHAEKRKAVQRKTWWKKNWAYAALIAAPLVGVSVAWLWQTAPTEIAADHQGSAEQYHVIFGSCSGPIRTTCVVDGDTIWLEGEKIRIADINTPEVSKPDCSVERALGERATSRLTSLLNEGGFSLRTVDRDEDRFGRKLRVVTRNGESLGATLVAEGLAETWTGSRRSWC
jgi:endonuclease YncB( thermonuclease family)